MKSNEAKYMNGNHQSVNTTSTRITGLFVLSVFATVLSAFQHGYNTSVTNAPLNIITDWMNSTYESRYNQTFTRTHGDFYKSMITAAFCVGGIVGALGTGLVANRFGRKKGLILNNIFIIVGAVMETASKYVGSYELIVLGRVFVGINSGLNAGIAPMYLTEISPVKMRGMIGSLYQLLITISILISMVLGIDSLLGTAHYWPWLFGLTIVPAILQIVLLFFCPESPEYTLATRDETHAVKILQKLRGTQDVRDDISAIRSAQEDRSSVERVRLGQFFSSPVLRTPLLIAVVMMIAQQFSGINVVMMYSTNLFHSAGLVSSEAQLGSIAIGIVNVVMTVISVVLVEKAGRKTLMMTGMCGMVCVTILLCVCLNLTYLGIGMSYTSIALVVLFVIFFATGPGSIPWFFVSELFSQSARPTATSIAVAVNWTSNFFVSMFYVPLNSVMGPYVFLIFVTILILVIIFTWYKVPETKGRTVEDIIATFA